MSTNAGLTKPRVILGCMGIGPNDAGQGITSLDEYNSALDHLQSQGYNEIDTARSYCQGRQENFTKEAQWQSRGLTVATKFYPSNPGDHNPDALEAGLEKSLHELGTDCVDIFYLHAADRSVPFDVTLRKLDELHKKGKFKQLGLSNFTAFEVAEVVMHCKYNNWVRPSIYQGRYNAIDRALEVELIPTCHRYGIDVVIYGPIAGGMLSGKYKTRDLPENGRFSHKWYSSKSWRTRYFKDAVFDAVKIIEDAAEKHNLTVMEVALRWLTHHSALNIKDGGHDGVIIGVSKGSHLAQNIADLEKGPLPQDVVEAVDEAWLFCKSSSQHYWHGDVKYTYDPQRALFGA